MGRTKKPSDGDEHADPVRLDDYNRRISPERGAPRPGKTTLTQLTRRPGSKFKPADTPPPAGDAGAPLPPDVRGKMEESLGADFSAVRVHEGAHVEAKGALAYAQGADLHFAPGQYDPHGQHGQALLGHELAHVVQQAQGRVGVTQQAKGLEINDDPALEREADEWGARAARGEARGDRGESVGVIARGSSAIQGLFVRGPRGTFIDQDTNEEYLVVGDEDGDVELRSVSTGATRWIRRVPLIDSATETWESVDDTVETDDEPPLRFERGSAFVEAPPPTRMPASSSENAPSISLVTNFTVQVTAVPLAQGSPTSTGDMHYTADRVWVEGIRLGNQDRPDTRFGGRQERHTVAWTLERAAQIAQSGQSALAVLLFYVEEFRRLASTPQPDPTMVLIREVLIAANALLVGRLPIDRWQAQLSYIATIYTQAYQASSAATMKSGAPVGHGEGTAMGVLRQAEETLVSGGAVPNPDDVIHAAATLLDVQFNASLGGEGYAIAVRHWVHSLVTAFPNLMNAHGDKIVEPVLQRKVATKTAERLGADSVDKLVASSGPAAPSLLAGITTGARPTVIQGSSVNLEVPVPAELDVDFVANVEVAPEQPGVPVDTTMQLSGADPVPIQQPFYSADQLSVIRVSISDKDRPDTRFRTQMSHTVAWTLVRAELTALRGQLVNRLLVLLGRRLMTHVADIRDPHAVELAITTIDQVRELLGAHLAIHQWQAVISDIVRRYTIVYQKVGAASFVDETTLARALGHGEASHMERLRRNETNLTRHGTLADEPDTVLHAATMLLDAHINDSLTPEQFVSAVLHWHEMMRRVFPNIAGAAGDRLPGTLRARSIPATVAATYKVANAFELVERLAPVVGSGAEFDVLHSVHRPGATGVDPVALATGLGFAHHPMAGDGNDCALNAIFHQLAVGHGLAMGDLGAFAHYVRTRANLPFGSMIDVLANGRALLAAVQGWLNQYVPGAANSGLVIDVWSATAEGGLMEYQNVAGLAGDGVRVMRLYFNGVNHFDSLLGGPPR